MTLDEIIADLQAQLDWRGPGGQPQGHIVIPRSEAQELLNEIRQLRAGIVANPERIWQGRCGHLWHHDGSKNPSCPICDEIKDLRERLQYPELDK